MQWSHWFAGMMDVQPADRMYNCLPMYHSVGGVQVVGALLVAGGAVVIREKFSASQFWDDIVRWDCTLFEYIGELCRYLLHATPSANETEHRIRLACGNGLAPEIWNAFKDRFRIPQILEFYAATEGSVSLFNVQGKRGAIGHIPPYLSHRFSPALISIDVETGEPARSKQGFCIACAPNQAGEALGKVVNDHSNLGSRFEGYTSAEASEKKILRDVFEHGDAWFRTGDLMRKDEKGYYYFVDRIGDTFRWKGENVSTAEVAAKISAYGPVQEAIVYGVAIPSTDGRAGMVAIVAASDFDLGAFREHLRSSLPDYACPLFLRMCNSIEATSTFKSKVQDLARQGYDPAVIKDPIFFYDRLRQGFVRLDVALHRRLQNGELRL
jgi:fatty-acyl-CoA synthase